MRFFPSGAFAWKLGEEDFVKNLDWVDNLKLRTSYGLTGNQEIPTYRSLATLSPSFYNFGGALVPGFGPSRLANPDLRWEKTTQFDIGLDFSLFNRRVDVTLDYYNKKTTDLLLDVRVPSVSGFSSILKNIGSVK